MGLDMFLRGSLYLSEYDDTRRKIKEQVSEILGSAYGSSMNPTGIEVEIGYWRKANAIHHWFVDNVQNGVDDCKSYYVSKEQLIKLRDLCQDALTHQDRAPEILGTQGGFFFGSTDYDEWYFESLKDTIEIVSAAIKLPDEWDITYQSSW